MVCIAWSPTWATSCCETTFFHTLQVSMLQLPLTNSARSWPLAQAMKAPSCPRARCGEFGRWSGDERKTRKRELLDGNARSKGLKQVMYFCIDMSINHLAYTYIFFSPKQFTVGVLSYEKKRWPHLLCPGSVSGSCPPLVCCCPPAALVLLL